MKKSDFYFELPDELIARYPAKQRTDSRLLYFNPQSGQLANRQFSDILDYCKAGDIFVFNNTRVIPARLWAHKITGGRVELLVERMLDNRSNPITQTNIHSTTGVPNVVANRYSVIQKVLQQNQQKGGYPVLLHLRASKMPKPGDTLLFDTNNDVTIELIERSECGLWGALIHSEQTLLKVLQAYGEVPLPPYIDRQPESLDSERYQTVYAEHNGAVAAPTAGLHFDKNLLAKLSQHGIETAYVTLHVGAGTFQPVRVEDIQDHVMHAECLEVSEETCAKIKQSRQAGGRVISVGTTVARALETVSQATGEPQAYQGETQIFIYPGYQFSCVDAMITNFHLPESTLLMMLSAFAGREGILKAYEHAIRQRYRFFSYGDAMFVDSLAKT